jgi:dipeptidyl aminopeptidase/acylaminoacyl peptidase
MMQLGGATVKQETVDDAVAAAVLLRSTPRIDPRRVVVLGHSLGGMLIPRIAADAPQAAGFIVMAGAARSLDQAMLEQARYLAQLDGSVTSLEQQAIDQMEKQQAAVQALTPNSPPVGNIPATYWLDLRGYDPPTAAKAITRPLLVLQGERDYQVTPAEYARWQSALAGSRTATFHLYPGLNHLFITGTGPASPAEYSTPGHVAEDVIRDIVAWVAALPPLTAAR